MTLENQLKQLLKDEPRSRERRNKVRAVAHVLRKTHPVLGQIVPEVLQLIVNDVIALERYWRKILVENPELQGKDYNTKRQIVQEYQQKIGYESGYNVKINV